jgi:hypothetical protein
VPVAATTGPISVAATGGLATSAGNFTVDVPGFTINLDPAQLTITRAQSATVNVNILRGGGFAGKVTVSVPDTTALKIKFAVTSQATKGPSLSFTFKVKRGAPVGMQQIIFTGQDKAGNVRTATLFLNIQ